MGILSWVIKDILFDDSVFCKVIVYILGSLIFGWSFFMEIKSIGFKSF